MREISDVATCIIIVLPPHTHTQTCIENRENFVYFYSISQWTTTAEKNVIVGEKIKQMKM